VDYFRIVFMKDKEVQLFLRAAEQRLTSASILYENTMYLDAIYLSGYVVECSLKALLLSHVPLHERKSYTKERFHGAIAHDPEYLKALLRIAKINIPKEIAQTLRKVASWRTDLRYAVGRVSARESRSFLDCAKVILDWARRSI
jgi:HEPN domain-containing protein